MPIDRQPHLKGELVELRPLRAEDFEVLYAVASDPLIWEQHPEPNRCERDVFQVFFQRAMVSGGAFLVLDAVTQQVIGSTRYDAYNEEQSEVEIGWTFLARSHWGGHYNGEMKRLMLKHAFQFVDNVVFLIGPNNMRSRRAVEKIGGQLTGTRKHIHTGVEHVVYRIRAAEFLNEHEA